VLFETLQTLHDLFDIFVVSDEDLGLLLQSFRVLVPDQGVKGGYFLFQVHFHSLILFNQGDLSLFDKGLQSDCCQAVLELTQVCLEFLLFLGFLDDERDLFLVE
jgi:hypothetical protein